eukprot:68053-Rhodomonas_salina.1
MRSTISQPRRSMVVTLASTGHDIANAWDYGLGQYCTLHSTRRAVPEVHEVSTGHGIPHA